MNASIHKFAFSLTACLLTCVTGHAYEQDNWYLAWEKSISDSNGVAYYEDNSTGIGQIYLLNGNYNDGKISVYDLNGSLDRHITIANNRYDPRDLCLDDEGNIYIAEYYAVTSLENDGTFKWRTGKNATASNYGSGSGTGNGEFSQAFGITLRSNGNLYVAEYGNHRVQVLDKNGTFIRKFGEQGTAPGQLSHPRDLIFLPDGRLIVGDNSYLNYFDSNGTFITRTNAFSASYYVSVAPDGTIWSQHRLRDKTGAQILQNSYVNEYSRTAFTPEGDLIESGNSKLRLWKRAYRTKGLVNRNVIPQPAIRGVTQRAGTNVLDVDFEIVDPDDANATIGIIAYCGNDKIVPQTWVDGTGSKINSPIATNQVHRVSWDVKQDWATSTGTIKFEILCQDGRTNKPVDLHFLTLPFPDGNMTISRSPLKDSDFQNYAKYLLAKGDAQFESNSSNAVIIPAEANTAEVFTFTNCGATGRIGPTEAQIQAEYNGTNLQGLVTTGWKAGYQKWTVPATGDYWIEAIGAKGGDSGTYRVGGKGAFLRGKFSLSLGQELNIIVGQQGENSGNLEGAGGGGGSFVVADTNNTVLLSAGAGGGAGRENGIDASVSSGGIATGNYTASSNGEGGKGDQTSGGGGGFLTNGSISSPHLGQGGKSYQDGALGGTPGHSGAKGGFGGGGSVHASWWDWGGGGGGFSGGSGGSGGDNSTGFNGGGGGSSNAGSNKQSSEGLGGGHGVVRIYRAEGVTPTSPALKLLNNDWKPLVITQILLEELGSNYRFATTAEVTKAREAATPGSVNNWTASVQVKPRNLPGSVNEYGFDVSTTSGYWVIKE